MFTRLKALWSLLTQIQNLQENLRGKEYIATGLTLSQAERQMIHEMHNLITVRFQDFLEYENYRITQEAMANIEKHRQIILDKGECLEGEDFNAQPS